MFNAKFKNNFYLTIIKISLEIFASIRDSLSLSPKKRVTNKVMFKRSIAMLLEYFCTFAISIYLLL
jgi:hypothetical protein